MILVPEHKGRSLTRENVSFCRPLTKLVEISLAKPQSREGDDDALLDESMTTDIIEACNTLLR